MVTFILGMITGALVLLVVALAISQGGIDP